MAKIRTKKKNNRIKSKRGGANNKTREVLELLARRAQAGEQNGLTLAESARALAVHNAHGNRRELHNRYFQEALHDNLEVVMREILAAGISILHINGIRHEIDIDHSTDNGEVKTHYLNVISYQPQEDGGYLRMEQPIGYFTNPSGNYDGILIPSDGLINFFRTMLQNNDEIEFWNEAAHRVIRNTHRRR